MKKSTKYYTNKKISAEIDLKFKKIGINKVASIIDRDFHGTTTYVNDLLQKYGNNRNILSPYISDQPVGYCIGGLFIKKSEKIGEIGMIHISPPMRNFGLSSLLCFIQYRYLMESKPDILYCEIADKTGKILHILHELKFTNTGEFSQEGEHPIWVRKFLSEKDRNTYNKLLESKIEQRLTKLSLFQNKIYAQATLVDIDNPDKLDFTKTVIKRLKTENMRSSLRLVPFFGYIGSKIRLARLPKDEIAGYKIILEISDIDIIAAEKLLQENKIHIAVKRSQRKKRTGNIRISTHPTWDISLLKQNTQKFAFIGKKLLTLPK